MMGLWHEFPITDCRYDSNNQTENSTRKWDQTDGERQIFRDQLRCCSLNAHPWDAQLNEGEVLLETRLALRLDVKAWQATHSKW